MVSEEEFVDASLRAVSDATRRAILVLLREGKMSVLEIAERFPMSRPAISKHLRILKEAGLVVETPAGRQRLYTLEATPLRIVQDWIAGLDRDSRTDRPTGVKPRSRARISRHGSVTQPNDWRVW